MIRIGEPRPIEPPPEVDRESVSYRSPVGDHTIVFSGEDEYAMGASFWNAHLVGADDETTKLPYALSVAPLQPWSPDGTRFAYLGTEKLRQPGRVLLGDIAAGFRWTTAPTGARGIFWSSSQPVLLTIGPGWLRLLDQQGRMTRSHDWRNGEDDPVYGGWLASGERFFVIAAETGHKAKLRAYDASGTLLGEEPLDPADLLPFDTKAFASLERGRYSLRLGPGTRSIAALLDRWSDARYDPATGDLRLAVYRPTGPVGPELAPAFQQLSELTAPAAMQWIAVRVSE
ncbi:MAG TPA: hypothetical protein VEN31_05295 [Candidatus Bathyarchaeia archaeon]|nr:hypothetical protein [Candidatus Bathyarchaeia archaeon]